MNDGQKVPNEYPRTWFFMGVIAAGMVAYWTVNGLIADDPPSIWWLVLALPFGALSVVMPRRERRQIMDYLRRMNRGKMDLPGWTKKPWQHDTKEVREKQ